MFCHHCGAQSGFSYTQPDGGVLQPFHITESLEMAVLLWNARSPVNEKAISLINRLIDESFKTIQAYSDGVSGD